MSDQPFPAVDAHVVDTNCFVVFERNDAVDLLERGVSEYDTPPVDEAIDAGWVEILEDVDYTNPVVSATMDRVRQYIAATDERPEHTVEQADAEVGGAAATILERGAADSVAVYTNDVAAFRGIERALAEHGYGEQVRLVRSFDFFDDVVDRYQFVG